jgi:hypothetical protein
MPTIAEAEARIREGNRPVLFLDTCIYLDIIRAPDRSLKGYVQSGLDLLGLLTEDTPRCTLVAVSMIPREWTDNAEQVRDEENGRLMKLQKPADMFHDTCSTLNITPPFGRPNYSSVGMIERLHEVSKKLLDRSMLLDKDDACRLRGVDRVVFKIPPAEHSKEVKDCVIVEECLELTRQLRANGFTSKCVFCTSNTKDYGEPGGKLHPILDTEFVAIDLLFTSNLPWAVHEVTH